MRQLETPVLEMYIYKITLGCSFGLDPGRVCRSDICDNTKCPDYPNAACYPDVCSDCSPRYFVRNTEVTEVCGKTFSF